MAISIESIAVIPLSGFNGSEDDATISHKPVLLNGPATVSNGMFKILSISAVVSPAESSGTLLSTLSIEYEAVNPGNTSP